MCNTRVILKGGVPCEVVYPNELAGFPFFLVVRGQAPPQGSRVLTREGLLQGGWTPLHLAAINNIQEVARVLLDAGADPNAKTEVRGGSGGCGDLCAQPVLFVFAGLRHLSVCQWTDLGEQMSVADAGGGCCRLESRRFMPLW